MTLEGKVAIVTGAGRGIGREIALRLARDGASVVVSDIDLVSAESTESEIVQSGRRAMAVRTDVTSQSDCVALAERAMAEFGRIDIMVNNAGIVQVKPWRELRDEDLDRMYAVNVKGVVFGCQAVAPYLIAQGSGRIINTASLAAKTPKHLFLHYGASKAAVVNLSRSLAHYFAPYNVTVNSVCPGIVDTKMWEYLDEELGQREGRAKGETIKQRVAIIPLGRVEVPEDVAGVVAFLASDDSRYMTGQSLLVDGGMYME